MEKQNKRGPNKPLTTEARKMMIELKGKRLTVKQIAKQVGYAPSTVSRETGSINAAKNSTRPAADGKMFSVDDYLKGLKTI